MRYLIYDSLNEQIFNELKEKIVLIEETITPFVSQYGFYLNSDSIYGDGLGLDYSFDDGDVMGNIGFSYDDKKIDDNFIFHFYVLKAHDSLSVRNYKRENFPQGGVAFSKIEEQSLIFFNECIELFKAWNKNELSEKIPLK